MILHLYFQVVQFFFLNPRWVQPNTLFQDCADPELIPHIDLLRAKLTLYSHDSTSLLSGGPVFFLNPRWVQPNTLFQDCADPVVDTNTQTALELATGGMLLILQRQEKDQLTGGKFYDCPVAAKMRGAIVPTTNTSSERDFDQLEMLMRLEPSASTECLESLYNHVDE